MVTNDDKECARYHNISILMSFKHNLTLISSNGSLVMVQSLEIELRWCQGRKVKTLLDVQESWQTGALTNTVIFTEVKW